MGGDKKFEEWAKTMETSLGWTSLHCAIEKENFDLTVKLIQEGSDVCAHDNFNRTPLSMAASKGNLKLVDLLLEKGTYIDDGFPLHYACEKGRCDLVTHLIKNGADVNLVKNKTYPIIIAAAKGNLQIAEILIKSGADVNVVDDDKETALHWVCETGNMQLMSLLIDAGCDINAKDRFDLTPLSVCLIRMENYPELVKLLLEKGASANMVDNYCYTNLHHSENAESTSLLIKHGANVNAQNDCKDTPLYNVTCYGHIECAKVLLKHGADPNITDAGGWVPLHVATKEGNLEYLEDLLKWKASINVASAQNVIPLHCAASKGHMEVVRRLLECGSLVDVPVIDIPHVNSLLPHFVDTDYICDEATPLYLAAVNGHVEVCKLLIENGASSKGISCIPEEILDLTASNKRLNDWPCHEIISSVRENNLELVRTCPVDSALHVTDLIGWTLLHHSVYKGFCEMTSLLIDKGLSVNSVDNYERTPLSIAAARNDVSTLKLLLDRGADINLGLALHYAAYKNSVECMLELINRDCDIDIKNKKDSESPVLVEAASESKSEIIKTLLENHANPNNTNKWGETALHQSCRFGDAESVRALLQHGADVNAVDSCQDTPLICASVSNNAEVIKILLENGADINVVDNAGWTPLHRAASHFPEGVLELIRGGICVDQPDNEGETALFLAAENLPALEALTENGADVNFVSPGGWMPLHEAAAGGKVECVKQLLKFGAKINSASAENVLPIYLASIYGNVEVVEELIRRGSYLDSSICDTGVVSLDAGVLPLSKRYNIVPGNTPVIGAASKCHLEVIKMLHSHGASLDAVNFKGNTALHEAILHNFEQVAEFLITAGADVDMKNKDQKTALDLANEMKLESIVNLVID